MTSIHTNAASMAAISAARLISASMARQMNAAATGLRISEASHNAAYWSISTTMRSDARAVATVIEALGLAAATADVAYAGMTQVVEVLGDIRSRLVVAYDDPGRAGYIQAEIEQMVAHTRQIAGSASFAGANWLATDIEDIFDPADAGRSTSLVSSFKRDADGRVGVGSIAVDLARTSLYNSEGGGILQADPRSPYTIGGVRTVDPETGSFRASNTSAGGRAIEFLTFSGPVDLSGGGAISFDLTVDADAASLPAPRHGGSTVHVVIDEALVNAVVPGAGGVISGYREMAAVLSSALSGTGAAATLVSDWRGEIIPDRYAIMTMESSGLDGSSVGISGLSGGGGGLHEFHAFGSRGSSITLSFAPFKVWNEVEITFDFFVNGSSQAVSVTKEAVNAALGKEDGRVDTAEEMAVLLQGLVGMPGLEIEAMGAAVRVRTDDSDRLNGSKSRIGFTDIRVNIEPIPGIGLEDIDVSANPGMVPAYMQAVDAMLSRAVDGAAVLGSVKGRIDMMARFNSLLADSFERGISQLVDADMEEVSTRLKALKVQQDLSVLAMGIANAAPGAILQLFMDQRES